MLVLIKGAGDLSSGIACRLYRSGFQVVMTETARPTTVRCTVAFSRAVYRKETQVEDIPGQLAVSTEECRRLVEAGVVAVAVDPECQLLSQLHPDALVDAIIAKRNTGTRIDDAPVVIGVGPGFTAGVDCDAAVEAQRGHDLGRVLYRGSPTPDTGIPGEIGGYTTQRVLRAEADGIFMAWAAIGDSVRAGQEVGRIGTLPVRAQISGVLRGLLPDQTPVYTGMKVGDVDPRCRVEHCYTVSDKANAVGGGVLEAILNGMEKRRRNGL